MPIQRYRPQSRTQFEHYQEATAAQRTEDRQAAEQRIARLDQELALVRQQLVTHQATVAQQSGQFAQLTAENMRMRDALQTAQQDWMQARSEQEQLARQAKELAIARDALQVKQDSLQQELAEAHTALAVYAKEARLLTERLTRTENQAQALMQEKLDFVQQHALLQAELRQCWEQAKNRITNEIQES